MILYQKDNHNIVTLTFDMKGRSVNVINHELVKAFAPVLDLLEKDQNLAGVIMASNKRSFLAGGDLDYLHQVGDASKLFDYAESMRRMFRRLERLQVPVVALINGAALGSGYEITLACHRRIALDSPKTVIGLPEVSLGMIPGGGSIARLTWLLGFEEAFEVLTKAKRIHVREALQKGLIDEIAPDKMVLFERARQWILSKPDLRKPWDKGTIPDRSNPRHPQTAQTIFRLSAQTLAKTKGNYQALQTILHVMTEGSMVDFDTARRMESRYFTQLVLSKECQNMTKAHWYDANKIHNGANRPKGFGRFRARKIGIIGAGVIGAGLAYVCALEGIEVVLKDISVAISQQGKDTVRGMLERLVQSKRMSAEQAKAAVNLIQPTESFADFEDCDFIVESVFENKDLKIRVAREAEGYLNRYAFIASNTATLSISQLAEACSHSDQYIGMRLFYPVYKMPLVEIVCGKQTSDEVLAKVFDFVRQIGKTPIVVRDSPGYFVSRVVRRYLLEGIQLLLEGVPPTLIENLAEQAGMHTAPLALADEVGLNQLLFTEESIQKRQGYAPYTGLRVLSHLLSLGRTGKSKGQGFYEYPSKGKSHFWEGLAEHYPSKTEDLPSNEDVVERLLFIQCLEAVLCLQEEVIGSSAEANLGSIHGWGFVPFKGGVIQFINDYGVCEFVERCQVLASRYGRRFSPPALLLEMYEEKRNFM